jgi:hypothetical protein
MPTGREAAEAAKWRRKVATRGGSPRDVGAVLAEARKVAARHAAAPTLDGWRARAVWEAAEAARADFGERAGIMEYLGNLPRATAERRAREITGYRGAP